MSEGKKDPSGFATGAAVAMLLMVLLVAFPLGLALKNANHKLSTEQAFREQAERMVNRIYRNRPTEPALPRLVRVKVVGICNATGDEHTMVETPDGQRLKLDGNPWGPRDEVEGREFVVRRTRLPANYQPFTAAELQEMAEWERLQQATQEIDLGPTAMERPDPMVWAAYEAAVNLWDLDEQREEALRTGWRNFAEGKEQGGAPYYLSKEWLVRELENLARDRYEKGTTKHKPPSHPPDWLIKAAAELIVDHWSLDDEVKQGPREAIRHWGLVEPSGDKELQWMAREDLLRQLKIMWDVRERVKANDGKAAQEAAERFEPAEGVLTTPTYSSPVFSHLNMRGAVFSYNRNVRVFRSQLHQPLLMRSRGVVFSYNRNVRVFRSQLHQF